MKKNLLAISIAILASLLFVGQSLANGIGPMASPETLIQLSNDQISEVQKILITQEYEIDVLDGTLNAQTKEALREFQEDRGLTITGMPDDETLRALSPTLEKDEFFGLSPEFGEVP